MNVSDLGEFGLIELLAKIVGPAESKSVLIGIGDDAACWRTEASTQLATTDSLIQDVHFTLSTTTWRELGWKALAVSLSDIAAMGGQPQYAMVSLGLPGDTEIASIAELYEGMAELARLFDVSIVGGDSVEAPVVMLSLVVIGKAQETQNVLTRSAKRKYKNDPQGGSPETPPPRCRGANFSTPRRQGCHRPERRACQ